MQEEALAEAAARIESQVRATHLTAHLDRVVVLTPAQVAAYNRLRGYESGWAPVASLGRRGPFLPAIGSALFSR